jgi:hypothetical protein
MYNDLDNLLSHDLKREGYKPEMQGIIRYQFGKTVSDLVTNSDN